MMKTFEGKLVSRDMRVGIVASRFNEFITAKLLSGALDGAAPSRRGRGGHPRGVGTRRL